MRLREHAPVARVELDGAGRARDRCAARATASAARGAGRARGRRLDGADRRAPGRGRASRCGPSRARSCACATRPGRACCGACCASRAATWCPARDGRYVLGATVEERGFELAATAGGVYELLRDAHELVPGRRASSRSRSSRVGLRPGTPDNAPGDRRRSARRACSGRAGTTATASCSPRSRPSSSSALLAGRGGEDAERSSSARTMRCSGLLARALPRPRPASPSAARRRRAGALRVIVLNGERSDVRARRDRRRGARAPRPRSPTRAGVAVAVDGEVVPRAAWESFALAEDARVEVLTAMQGG